MEVAVAVTDLVDVAIDGDGATVASADAVTDADGAIAMEVAGHLMLFGKHQSSN